MGTVALIQETFAEMVGHIVNNQRLLITEKGAIIAIGLDKTGIHSDIDYVTTKVTNICELCKFNKEIFFEEERAVEELIGSDRF